MRERTTCLIAMLALLLVTRTASIAEENSGQRAASYVPRLSDLMVVIQIRHAKLFYAVKARNWPLADYELEQLVGTLKEAGRVLSQYCTPYDPCRRNWKFT